MKDFWKRYSYDVAKVAASRLIACFFAISLLAVGGKTNFLKFVIMGCGLVIYFFLMYSQVWKVGQHDFLLAEGKIIERRPLTGLWIGLMAGTPDMLIFLLTVVNKLLPSDSLTKILAVVYFIYDGIFWPLVTQVIGGKLWFYAVTFLPCALWCALCYWLGLNGIHKTKIFISENPEEKEIRLEKKEERKK